MAPGAVVCIQCGFNRQTGKRMQTVSRRMEHHFYTSGLSLRAMAIAAVLLLVLLAALAWGLSRDGQTRASRLQLGAALVCLCLVFLSLGTTTRLTFTRDSAGKPLLITRRWVLFVPLASSSRDLSEYNTIRFNCRDGLPNAWEYLAVVVLRGVWAMGHKYETYSVEIDASFEVDGTPPTVKPVLLYRGTDERRMRKLGELLKEHAELRYG
jgi:hypothetical protein